MIAFQILTFLLLAYLGWAVVYQLFYAFAGHFFKTEKGNTDKKFRHFAVLIPAYREDAVVVETVKAALRQNYPNELYEVVPIADQLWTSTIKKMKQLGVQSLEVSFEESTKSKSINAALAHLGDDFDAVVVLDADNHMRPDFLLRMNEAMGKGFQALQGCRAAKNTDSSMSVLDGVSEAVNNHLLCSGHRAVGLSARLAGSGMAFDYQIFKNVMASVDALGGFDKELELKLTQMGVTIGYAPEAIVLDEKVNNTNSYSRQRGRWLAAQYRYGRRFAGAAAKALLTKGQVDFFNKTLQMALPPRLVLPGVLAFGTVVSALFGQDVSLVWLALLVGNLTSFALAIPRSHWNADFFKALLQLPKTFAATLKALTLMPLASKQFLHTPHGTAYGQATA
ncbi:MAG: glycosyltransferase [Bacteroidetes bacterium]|nr:glycosyltransferase [Bacteroidota bacterium]